MVIGVIASARGFEDGVPRGTGGANSRGALRGSDSFYGVHLGDRKCGGILIVFKRPSCDDLEPARDGDLKWRPRTATHERAANPSDRLPQDDHTAVRRGLGPHDEPPYSTVELESIRDATNSGRWADFRADAAKPPHENTTGLLAEVSFSPAKNPWGDVTCEGTPSCQSCAGQTRTELSLMPKASRFPPCGTTRDRIASTPISIGMR